jgi:hypothetical protein
VGEMRTSDEEGEDGEVELGEKVEVGGVACLCRH